MDTLTIHSFQNRLIFDNVKKEVHIIKDTITPFKKKIIIPFEDIKSIRIDFNEKKQIFVIIITFTTKYDEENVFEINTHEIDNSTFLILSVLMRSSQLLIIDPYHIIEHFLQKDIPLQELLLEISHKKVQ